MQKENICISFSLTELSSSTLALVRRFEVIPGGIFHRLENSEIEKEHLMICIEKKQ